jgi:hypothetical protein
LIVLFALGCQEPEGSTEALATTADLGALQSEVTTLDGQLSVTQHDLANTAAASGESSSSLQAQLDQHAQDIDRNAGGIGQVQGEAAANAVALNSVNLALSDLELHLEDHAADLELHPWTSSETALATEKDVQMGALPAPTAMGSGPTLHATGLSLVESAGGDVTQHGYHVFGGQTAPFAGGPSDGDDDCQVIIDQGFDDFIAGRIIATSGDMANSYAAATMVDVFYRRGAGGTVVEVESGGGWNGSYLESYSFEVRDDAGQLQVLLCQDATNTAWWTFSGVVF